MKHYREYRAFLHTIEVACYVAFTAALVYSMITLVNYYVPTMN